MNPDFELYENVGRSADQIHAYNTLTATTDDLYRWARRDAERFLAQQPLPGTPLPTPSARPYLAALNNARTPAEASAVTNVLLDATEPVLEAIGTYLAAAAKWQDPDRGAAKGSPPWLLRIAASQLRTALAMAAAADEDMLRKEYDPPPTANTHHKPSSPATPLPPTRPRNPRSAGPGQSPTGGRR